MSRNHSSTWRLTPIVHTNHAPGSRQSKLPEILWEAQTRDTFVVVADSIAFQAGVPYFWKVRARTGFDRWSETDFVSFTIVTATPERQ